MAFSLTFTRMTCKSMARAHRRLYMISNSVCLRAWMMYTFGCSPTVSSKIQTRRSYLGVLLLDVSINYRGLHSFRSGSADIIPTTAVRDLGIYIDADLSMRSHVQRTVAGCFAMLRQLRSIRRSVPSSVSRLWLSPLC